ncbi:pathogenesis-related thaumatin protein 3.5 [Trifolium repens]|nr:pathogenesis-related thaumatin protein 3.5 [Trifolium repens]
MEASTQISITLIFLFLFHSLRGLDSATFTIVNKCSYPVWPGILSGAGTAQLATTGFDLQPGESNDVAVPTAWSGHYVQLTPQENSLASPETAAHLSLVDGYNLPMLVEPHGSGGNCTTAGCSVDLNGWCPTELKVKIEAEGESSGEKSVACKSACEAFGDPLYCCSGAYATPQTFQSSQGMENSHLEWTYGPDTTVAMLMSQRT